MVNEPDILQAKVEKSGITAVECEGDANGEISIVASGGTPDYIYSADGGQTWKQTATIGTLASGNHHIVVKDEKGCIANTKVYVPVGQRMPIAGFYTNYQAGQFVNLTNTSLFAESYTWRIDGETYSTEDVSHTFTSDGSYDVKLTATNVCGSNELTKTIDVIRTSVESEVSAMQISAYPNPTNGKFELQFEGIAAQTNVNVRIMDITGKVVYTDRFEYQYDKRMYDIGKLSQGVYMLEVNTGNTIRILKIVKDQ